MVAEHLRKNTPECCIVGAMKQTFASIYSRLNTQQKKAVDTIDGPVMVIAGPGTGKTQVLAARIANILQKTDTRPENILALTFTESATKNMRGRVVQMIGLAGYRVKIETFHGFCKRVITKHPAYFSFAEEAEVISALEQYQLVQSILDEGQFYKLKPLKIPTLYVKEIIKAIADLKREAINPDKLAEMIEIESEAIEKTKSKPKKAKLEKQKAKLLELVKVYRAYELNLRSTGRFDFADMITMTLEAFEKNADLLLDYQEELHYFLVDEYQDTNSAQNQVVDLLASYWQEKANIFVVGDPHQSIFRFQGASLANIGLFLKKYPQAQVINLRIGYRCPQQIYDTAFSLMQIEEIDQRADTQSTNNNADVFRLLKFDQPLQSAKKTDHKNKKIKLYQAPTQLAEYIYLANKIKSLLKQGVVPESIAVLYRNNSESLALMEVLDKWGIDYDVAGGGNALEIEEISQLLNYLNAVYSLREGANHFDLFTILSYDWVGIDNLLAMKLARLAHRQKLSLVELIEKDHLTTTNGEGVLQITPMEKEQVQQFLDELRYFGSVDFNQPFVHFFELVIEKTGYLDWLTDHENKHELILALNSLFSQIKALNYSDHSFRLEDFLKTIALMRQYRLIIKVDDLNLSESAVTLSTVHKAKGLEWDHVFLTGLVDGKWGHKSKRGTKIKLPSLIVAGNHDAENEAAEEKRLFYVAMTRAAKELHLSFPQTEINQGRVKEFLASEFISWLKEKQLVELVDYHIDDQIEQNLLKILRPAPQKLALAKNQRAFFKHLVDKFSLSVSALNKYLHDPKDFALETLLKVPKAKAANLGYGTAVHKALELLNRHLIETGQLVDLEQLLNDFRQALATELIAETEINGWLTKGEKALTVYYQQRLINAESITPLQAEKAFYQVYLGDVRLTGKVDRVDWLDRAKKWVRVIDYKTGKARTLNDIEAKTVTSQKYLSEKELKLPELIRGPYKRQLLFYKILTDLDPGFPYQVKQGAFDFVEPNDNGKLSPLRTFEFADEAIEQMKQLIRQVMKEIRELKFLKELKEN